MTKSIINKNNIFWADPGITWVRLFHLYFEVSKTLHHLKKNLQLAETIDIVCSYIFNNLASCDPYF